MLYELHMCTVSPTPRPRYVWASPGLTNVSSRNVADVLYTSTCNNMHVLFESRRPIEKSTLHLQSFGMGR